MKIDEIKRHLYQKNNWISPSAHHKQGFTCLEAIASRFLYQDTSFPSILCLFSHHHHHSLTIPFIYYIVRNKQPLPQFQVNKVEPTTVAFWLALSPERKIDEMMQMSIEGSWKGREKKEVISWKCRHDGWVEEKCNWRHTQGELARTFHWVDGIRLQTSGYVLLSSWTRVRFSS